MGYQNHNYAQAQFEAMCQQQNYAIQQAAIAVQQKEPEMATNEQMIPDISITRVLKWAVVLLIAMALGRKVWAQFGDKITSQMNKALDAV